MSGTLQEILAEGLRRHRAGDISAAQTLYRRVLLAEPVCADALHLSGLAYHQAGQIVVAARLISRAILIDPGMAAYRSSQGIVFRALGRAADSEAAWRFAMILDPDFPEAYSNLGLALRASGQVRIKVLCYQRALRLRPQFAEARNNLAFALSAGEEIHEAVQEVRRALIVMPGYADALSNLGLFLQQQGSHVEAARSCRRAVAIRQDHAEAHANLANALQEVGDEAGADLSYRHALCLKPDHAEAHTSYGFLLLRRGRFADGWREIEWRWEMAPLKQQRRDYGVPQWMGDDPSGRTILLHAEQGMGDALQFCRYAPLVAARGGRVILEVHAPLIGLVRGVAGIDTIIAKGDPVPAIDWHCPLQSLPRAFATQIETIPNDIPYLKAEPERVARWTARLPKAGFRIGIVWQGSRLYKADASRSVPLALFEQLSRVPGVALISLQRGHGVEQLMELPAGMEITSLGDDFDAGDHAFLDSAAVAMSLDLVITVDTAMGHLAAALGRPVWLALSTVPHWPWMQGRDDTPWYPSMRLFRQKTAGNWPDVFSRMAHYLDAMARGIDAS